MPAAPRILNTLALAFLLVPAIASAAPREESRAFRSWIAGQEAGGSVKRSSSGPEGQRIDVHDWIRIERLGTEITQDLLQTALRRPGGALAFTFTLRLASEPLEGTAAWDPARPGRITVTYKGMAPRDLELPPGTVLWPGDEDEILKKAARERGPVHMKGWSVATQQPTSLDLACVGPDPLPGFPDTVRFKGSASDGTMVQDVEVWISPREADVRQSGTFGGIPLLVQRDTLPGPAPTAGAGFFERTLKRIPPHPFGSWERDVEVRWTGRTPQDLPADPLQAPAGPGRWRLRTAPVPAGAALAEKPVTGRPSPEDAPYLEATPLVQFRDPAVQGLLKRLAAPAGATRWDLTRRVCSFVYDWIQDKDFTVGFASAQEVARSPRGDCTEHGVLAVALLRALGVPSRGVVGWVALEGVLGLHFWAEARIGGAWVPIDPTFDMAPASAFRIKLGDTSLTDLGSVGWENAAASFQDGAWEPAGPWAASTRVQGDTVYAPGLAIRARGLRWNLRDGALDLDGHPAAASPRPGPALGARLIQAPSGRRGWFAADTLWADCGEGRWLRLQAVGRTRAAAILEALEIR